MNQFKSLFYRALTSENISAITLLDHLGRVVGTVYPKMLDLNKVSILTMGQVSSNISEKYLLNYDGISIFFSSWKKGD